jgi:hypothetical protein
MREPSKGETFTNSWERALSKTNGGAEGGRTPVPPQCELDDRQFVKYLPFRKLQPPRKIKGFAVLSHSLPAPHRAVLRILSTNWPQVFGVNPSVEIWSPKAFRVETDLWDAKGNATPERIGLREERGLVRFHSFPSVIGTVPRSVHLCLL